MGGGPSLRLARHLSRVNAKRGDCLLQADFRGLMPPWKRDSFRLGDDTGVSLTPKF
jgi:hypothetical protein